VTKIGVILLAGRRWKGLDINIRVCRSIDLVVHWLQECREVLFPLSLATPSHTAIQAAAVLSMIPNESSNMHHTRAVSCEQGKENPSMYFALKRSVPET
jgi:hypothetical protein